MMNEPQKVEIRSASNRDQEFLFRVFASTRLDITMASHLTEELKRQVMRSQFDAQRQHYADRFPNAEHVIIGVGGQDAGRLMVQRSPNEIHIIDIAILAEFRGQGIGSQILQNLMSEARKTDRPIRIHVEKPSPALQFYQRLGFVKINEIRTHFEMKWQPGNQVILSGASER